MKKVKRVKGVLRSATICLFTVLSLFAFNSFSERGGDAWAQTQTSLTKEQITERLKVIQPDRQYLEMKTRAIELRAEEQILQEALKNIEKAKAEAKKEEKK